MAVNRNKAHLVVLLEDQPYRAIVNGAKQMLNVNEQVLDVKEPSGGWLKAFNELESYHDFIANNIYMHVLLLIDFDHQFTSRKQKFVESFKDCPYEQRVFLLGIDQKQSEDLKRYMGRAHYEAIGKALVEHCPDHTAITAWRNTHLECNLPEIERMRSVGVFSWLFNS